MMSVTLRESILDGLFLGNTLTPSLLNISGPPIHQTQAAAMTIFLLVIQQRKAEEHAGVK